MSRKHDKIFQRGEKSRDNKNRLCEEKLTGLRHGEDINISRKRENTRKNIVMSAAGQILLERRVTTTIFKEEKQDEDNLRKNTRGTKFIKTLLFPNYKNGNI